MEMAKIMIEKIDLKQISGSNCGFASQENNQLYKGLKENNSKVDSYKMYGKF